MGSMSVHASDVTFPSDREIALYADRTYHLSVSTGKKRHNQPSADCSIGSSDTPSNATSTLCSASLLVCIVRGSLPRSSERRAGGYRRRCAPSCQNIGACVAVTGPTFLLAAAYTLFAVCDLLRMFSGPL